MSFEKYTEVFITSPPLGNYRGSTRWEFVAKTLRCFQIKLVTFTQIIPDDTYLYSFIKEHENVAMFPLVVGNSVQGYGFRSLRDKHFIVYSSNSLLFYSSTATLRMFNAQANFKYGDLIVLSEGVLDAEFFGLLSTPSFAYLKGKIDLYQAQYLSLITNNLIICPDNDKAGRGSRKITEQLFKTLKVNISFIDLPSNYKDGGEILIPYLKGDSGAIQTFNILKQELILKGGGIYG